VKLRLRRKLRQRQEQLPEISLTPLIDTALTLLIIFMVTTPMLQKENALQVELPKGNVKETQETQKEDLTVVITKKGEISFNNKIIKDKDLITVLQEAIGTKYDKTVFVKADTGASYGKVIELVDTIKHVGGIKYVALATTKIR
jgi:biopolymer transport protein ExbD